MQHIHHINRLGLRLVVVATVLMSLGVGLPAGATPAGRPLAQVPPIGPPGAIALDAAGNGWAWANPKPQTFATSFLLRIEDGQWTIAADSSTNPSLLAPGLYISRMVMTAQGDEGWAIGSVEAADTNPILWHLQNGAWHTARTSFPGSLNLLDLTMSADGSEGWMTAQDIVAASYKLLRLHNGVWDFVPEPTHGSLIHLAISPNGQSGWAVGPNTLTPQSNEGGFQLINGAWVASSAAFLVPDDISLQVTTDNAGDGWLLAAPDNAGSADDSLVRLAHNAPPQRLPTPIHLAGSPTRHLRLHSVLVDGLGHGWAVGSFDLGSDNGLPNPQELYQPVQILLRGATATAIPGAWVNATPQSNINLLRLAIADGGAHTWVGDVDGATFGHLAEMPQPWAHPDPIAAPLLPGAGRCFAAVPYCLRGVFSDYWRAHGGLDQFGFPITPEVVEHQGDQTYIVQYTERARLEYHPENQAPYDVLLGLLGNTLADPRQKEQPFQPKPASAAPGVQWFPQTQHNVGPPILTYWNTHGGLPIFGLPRSEAFNEKNAADGKTYRVQYFERNRIEYHPEHAGTKYEFQLGLLGVEQFHQTYGYTP